MLNYPYNAIIILAIILIAITASSWYAYDIFFDKAQEHGLKDYIERSLADNPYDNVFNYGNDKASSDTITTRIPIETETKTIAEGAEINSDASGTDLKSDDKKIINLGQEGGILFGSFADFGDFEDNVSIERIKNFHRLTGKNIAFAYFSNNWFDGINFPEFEVSVLQDMNIMPYVRIMPRNNFSRQAVKQTYTMERIANGDFDDELRQWAQDAKTKNTHLVLEFGTEVNGDWFPWNGKYNGGGITDEYGDPDSADGPERFIHAYRHIIDIFKNEGTTNVTWVYHINNVSNPQTDWNDIMAYYPGDTYIDAIGISAYGAQKPSDRWVSFNDVFRNVYNRITNITNKPLIIAEFGVTEGQEDYNKATWLTEFFKSLIGGEYPRVRAISYWHSNFKNSDGSYSLLRIDSSKDALSTFREYIENPLFLSEAQPFPFR